MAQVMNGSSQRDAMDVRSAMYRFFHTQHLVPCIAVSTLYVLLTMFLAEALRKIIEAAMPNKSLVKTAILEFVAAAEMCGCGFELIISEQVATCSYFIV